MRRDEPHDYQKHGIPGSEQESIPGTEKQQHYINFIQSLKHGLPLSSIDYPSDRVSIAGFHSSTLASLH